MGARWIRAASVRRIVYAAFATTGRIFCQAFGEFVHPGYAASFQNFGVGRFGLANATLSRIVPSNRNVS